MKASLTKPGGERAKLVARLAPGLNRLLAYQRSWLAYDVAAGVSVAAVAVPTAIAYAQIMGFDPVIGLYSSILPIAAYSLFGTSRHLIMNPDAATCALVGATLAPFAAGHAEALPALAAALAVFTGLVCILAGLFRIGFVADFLSRPILVGFLNGVAIHIFLGQIGKVFGFPMKSERILPSLFEFIGKVPQTHLPTLLVGLSTIALLLACTRFLPRWPAPLLAVLFSVALVQVLGLDAKGVAVTGEVPAGLPALRWPEFDSQLLMPLIQGAFGVALLSFSSAMVSARSFAAKGGYAVDADREFFALGASQIASGFSQGFPVSGAGSRTAISFAMGGKSQAAGLVACLVIAAVLVFLTEPLKILPKAGLGAVLVVAAAGLFDASGLRHLWHVSRAEFALALVTMFGVIALDVLNGILLAIGLSLVLVIARTSRPPDAVLGSTGGLTGFHSVADYPDAETNPGLILYRFAAAIMFFNAGCFSQRVLELAAARPDAKWLIVDGGSINAIDSTGAAALYELARDLRERGVKLGLANPRANVRGVLDRAGVTAAMGAGAMFPSIEAAVSAYHTEAGSLPSARD